MRQRLRVAAVAGFVLAVAFAFSCPASADSDDDPDAIAFGLGYFDIIKREHAAGILNFEYRSDKKLWIFKPMAGVFGTSDGGFYGYGGVRIDVYFGNRFVFTPSFAPGLYHKGSGKDLGFELEFRSSAELGYRFDDYSRLSLGIAHLSNASLGNKNPGVETLTLTYSVPIRNLLGN